MENFFFATYLVMAFSGSVENRTGTGPEQLTPSHMLE